MGQYNYLPNAWTEASLGELTGDMLCCSCGESVGESIYRYRKIPIDDCQDWEYQVQHRSCSKEDSFWRESDEKMAECINNLLIKRAAFKDFRNKWDVDVLDDDIERMDDELRQLSKLDRC